MTQATMFIRLEQDWGQKVDELAPEDRKPDSKSPTVAAGSTLKRPGTGTARRAVGESKPVGAGAAKKPDGAKVIALAVCGLLFVGCVGVLIYILVFKPQAVAKTGVDKLAPAAKALAEKADRAAKLYEDGKAKAGSDKLDDIVDSEKNMFEALTLFNEVADEYKTVPGYEDKIRLAHDKKLFIDAELKKVRDKKYELETQADNQRRAKAKITQPDKPAAEVASIPATTVGKEPTEEELSDKNLNRLFDDDPSEYERLAKIRKKKDPAFEMKKP